MNSVLPWLNNLSLPKKALLGSIITVSATQIPVEYIQQVTSYKLAFYSYRFNKMHELRKHFLFSTMRENGSLLELGPGTGSNFKCFPESVLWNGVDINPSTKGWLISRGNEAGFAENMLKHKCCDFTNLKQFADESFDTVACTQALSCASDPTIVLNEIFRVLKPGGRFYFVEHQARPKNTIGRLFQEICNPIRRFIGDGSNCNKEIVQSICKTGFESVYIESWPNTTALRKQNESAYDRFGVKRVRLVGSKTQDTTSSYESVEGFDGLIFPLAPIIAGVVRKNKEHFSNNPDYNLFKIPFIGQSLEQ